MSLGKDHWQFWIDTGGTFTDCIAVNPEGLVLRTKVLSSSRLRGRIVRVLGLSQLKIDTRWEISKDIFAGYELSVLGKNLSPQRVQSFDAKSSLITIAGKVDPGWKGCDFEITAHEEAPILASRILTETSIEEPLPAIDMRLGSTRGTNALLERKGAKVTFVVTKGFKDLVAIGTQQRPNIFELDIQKRAPLYDQVVEVDERIDHTGEIVNPLDEAEMVKVSKAVDSYPGNAIAIGLLNSYANPAHETRVAEELERNGHDHISVSHQLAPMIRILPRAETAIVNAYLAPVIQNYIQSVKDAIGNGQLRLMTSSGGLVGFNLYQPKDSLLSGPAGGVVGAAWSGSLSGYHSTITFDMGGTSTDVSRYDGDFDYQFESTVGDAHIFSPSLAIKTVASGGGSICDFDGVKFSVGPKSAGANPGPACYGSDGPLTITDVNLLLGRLDPDSFGIPINPVAAQSALQALTAKMRVGASQEEILTGFLEIANEKMADAIRAISIGKGFDASDYTLLSFGGAAGQHACRIAELLQIKRILVPYDAGLLSALGMGHARVERFAEMQILDNLEHLQRKLPTYMDDLDQEALRQLLHEGFKEPELEIRSRKLFIRFRGQDATVEINYTNMTSIKDQFQSQYESLFGHWIEGRPIEVESARVVASSKPLPGEEKTDTQAKPVYSPKKTKTIRSFVQSSWMEIPVFKWDELQVGATITGPALITSNTSTTFLDQGWIFNLDPHNHGLLEKDTSPVDEVVNNHPEEIQLELFTNRFIAIADDMGQLLQRASFSVNIKERLDFSCAILDESGELVVNAPHIPVHLGSLGVCTRRLIEALDLEEGDVAITNHPNYGGSHLPDITLVAPVFSNNGVLLGYVANRAHHAEIGGKRPGSMPPDARNLQEEGVIINPTYLVKKGTAQWEKINNILLHGPYPTRSQQENLADLKAALAAIRLGEKALKAAGTKFGDQSIRDYMARLKSYAGACLAQSLAQLDNGKYEAEEFLDDGTRIKARVNVSDKSADIDFSGSSPVHKGNLNANPSIVRSVVLYVLRLLINQELPLNEGLMKIITLTVPKGFLNPDFPNEPDQAPAVVGGNTETSQRIADTLLKAFGLAACSQGTMNNLLFGNDHFGYYETIAGGVGAGPGFDGQHAVHQHMTNTRITDPEIVELRYPARIERFEIRTGSGGVGKWTGGDGIIRQILFKEELDLTIVSQHRVQKPYGLMGGSDGSLGQQTVIRRNGERIELSGIDSCRVFPGDRFLIKTPGGGGYGIKERLD